MSLRNLRIKVTVFLFTISLFCGFTTPYSLATTYYVSSSTGSDSYAGTSPSSPWKTISKVNSEMAIFEAGDHILFKGGDTWNVGANGEESLLINNVTGANANNRVTFGAYGTGNRPIFTGNGDFRGQIVVMGTSRWINIDGLHLTSSSRSNLMGISPGTGGVIAEGIRISNCEFDNPGSGTAIEVENQGSQGNTTNIVVNSCIFHDCSHDGVRFSSGMTNSSVINSIFYDSGHNSIDFYDPGGTPKSDNMSVTGNTIYNSQQGIYMPACDNSLIADNDIYNSKDPQNWGYTTGIKVEAGRHSGPINVTIRNNRIWDVDAGTGTYALWVTDTSNLKVWNNTVYSCANTFLNIGNSNAYIQNNLAYANTGTTASMRNYSFDPLFVNAANGDFHLQSNSPCIDQGIDVGLPFHGLAPDLGAYEYVTDDGPPNPPTGLKVSSL